MSFSSPIFLFLFLPLVLAAYLVVPTRALRNLLLLAVSLIFYAWGEGAYTFLLLLSIAVNHLLGLWVDRARGTRSATVAVMLTVCVNLALLGSFKYTGFFLENVNALLDWFGARPFESPDIHLPIGLSFFTFQAMSYVLDIHMQKGPVQRNPLNTALYIVLFPQLVLGPIVRYAHIATEITARVTSRADFVLGAQRFAIGLAKKVLLADTLAIAVDAVFAAPLNELTTGMAWLGVAGFSLQLYFDFSGYSDMAIGMGQMFGFHFRENFKYPLFAQSRAEFFRRWHLSFFTWMRDYVYIPLSGPHCPAWRQNLNIVIILFLAGLWHGASWTFVLWGTASGLWIVLERLWIQSWLDVLWRPFRHVYTLSLNMVGLTLFRSSSLEQAWEFWKGLLGLAAGDGVQYNAGMFLDGEVALVLIVGALAATPIFPALRDYRARVLDPRLGAAAAGDLVLLTGTLWAGSLLLASAMMVAARTYTPFIYFQF